MLQWSRDFNDCKPAGLAMVCIHMHLETWHSLSWNATCPTGLELCPQYCNKFGQATAQLSTLGQPLMLGWGNPRAASSKSYEDFRRISTLWAEWRLSVDRKIHRDRDRHRCDAFRLSVSVVLYAGENPANEPCLQAYHLWKDSPTEERYRLAIVQKQFCHTYYLY